jgi:catechol 2,3-dioxygenase-like lactoylglutathione lyase family enzyme
MTLFGHMTVGARDLERSARFYDATPFPSARRGGS